MSKRGQTWTKGTNDSTKDVSQMLRPFSHTQYLIISCSLVHAFYVEMMTHALYITEHTGALVLLAT